MYLCKSHESSRLLKIFIGRETLPFSLEWVKLTFVYRHCLRRTMDGWMKENVSWINKQLFQQEVLLSYTAESYSLLLSMESLKMLNQYTVPCLTETRLSPHWTPHLQKELCGPFERALFDLCRRLYHFPRQNILVPSSLNDLIKTSAVAA